MKDRHWAGAPCVNNRRCGAEGWILGLIKSQWSSQVRMIGDMAGMGCGDHSLCLLADTLNFLSGLVFAELLSSFKSSEE